MIKITTIMDDLPSQHKALKTQHGLSFHVKTDNISLLFDFGATESTLYNVRKLNLSLTDMQFAVCSHSHYDHAGGYSDMVNAGLVCPFVTGDNFFDVKYARDGEKYVYLGCGFGKEFLQKNNICHQTCGDIKELCKGCYAVGNFQRVQQFESIPARFIKNWPEKPTLDDFSGEICLAIESERGLIVIVGCSHPGILNMLGTVRQRLRQPIYAVIGGIHLVEADAIRTSKTISEIKKMGVKLLGLNHCSGELVQKQISEDTKLKSCYLGAGDCLSFQ